ncbi:rhomboid family intramembrane serine protease [Streptomyces europaeiscabiei]|uniref:Rhomboid family intramembrane serine protease n=1 Tax=Streptomyces europaeiscabiei TaxID=146819 RepID=A0ABU4NGZ8_9ACTN|nr:rhomboid family intramembrane serine protease [Streptomyces europaeiscabiei]MDX3544995.1 rhomboid family intramembrane serine protease [Streptomyces europaeiscabiei]MDX3554683.1 rhomboid family intramembrane serine protease [Streptomyces europaeiscabiei]MDX3702415.1 rhomboid family intramembrane serine protease [Streptomyces europaeiscabiei]MDX3712494.1 rhomboid family intramembrane serine protease [Streptomyces europaeiscabiei]MDX3831326.1 rhomboid family intramembrane serine protease [Str
MDQVPSGSQDAQSLPTCYRHPDRETGIRCTRCERPICPECMVSASVGFQCPECVRGGSSTGHAPSASAPRTLAGGTVAADPRLLTKILIGVNLLLFLVQMSVGDTFTDRFSLIGRAWVPELGSSFQGVAEGQWYRLVTSMFLHSSSSVTHILFNMLSLWWIGGPLEAALGRARYLALYFVSGLAGSALTYLLAEQNQPSLGASGAIFGLFGATGVLMRRLNYDMRPLIILLVINLIFTFSPMFNIAWEAHVGGLVAGVLIGYAMVHAPRERRALIQYGACALVLAAVVVMTLLRTAQLT